MTDRREMTTGEAAAYDAGYAAGVAAARADLRQRAMESATAPAATWVLRYLGEPAAEVEGDGWRPIETAPRDALLLGWLPPQIHLGTVVYEARPEIIVWHRRAWRDLVHGWNLKPTHWQPLPPPPETRARPEGEA